MTQTNDILNITPATAAASAGDWQKVEKLLAAGADVKSCNLFGQNALYFALIDSKFDIAAALYDAGARLDELIRNGNGHSILTDIAELRRTGRDFFPLQRNLLLNSAATGLIKRQKNIFPVQLQLTAVRLLMNLSATENICRKKILLLQKNSFNAVEKLM